MKPSIFLGNNFAVLVAAYELSQRGQDVIVLTDGKTLGGHFAGLRIQCHYFDIGMVYFETCAPAIPGSDLQTYDPSVRNDWTRFGDRASTWLNNKVDLTPVPTPVCLVEGNKVPDFLIANRLDGLKNIPAPPSLIPNDPRHAANKCLPGIYDTLTYAEASHWNHGLAWHQRFIEPFVEKVFGLTSTQFLARFHRAAWVPLYYPETLNLAAMGQPTGLPEYRFWTTPSGFSGQLVQELISELAQSRHVKIVTEKVTTLGWQPGGWCISTASSQPFTSQQLTIGVSPDRAAQLLGLDIEAPKVTVTLVLFFVLVPAYLISDQPACLMVVDPDHATYRLTNQDASAGITRSHHRLVLEASLKDIQRLHPGKSAEDALLCELMDLLELDMQMKSSVEVLHCLTAHNAMPIPTPLQVNSTHTAAQAFQRALPGVALTGNLLGFGLSSLNDQLIQGMKISEMYQ